MKAEGQKRKEKALVVWEQQEEKEGTRVVVSLPFGDEAKKK